MKNVFIEEIMSMGNMRSSYKKEVFNNLINNLNRFNNENKTIRISRFNSFNSPINSINNIDTAIIASDCLIKEKERFDKVSIIKFNFTDTDKIDVLIEPSYSMLMKFKLSLVFICSYKKIAAVTKEKSVIELEADELASFIYDHIIDEYYSTSFCIDRLLHDERLVEAHKKHNFYMQKYMHKFEKVYGEKYVFGTIAVRIDKNSFLTTARGKNQLDDFAIVKSVDHESNQVLVYGTKKATLNAPLLSKIFENQNVDVIVHYHQTENLPDLDYAFPGTVKDSIRNIKGSFNIKYHGCFLLFNVNRKIII